MYPSAYIIGPTGELVGVGRGCRWQARPILFPDLGSAPGPTLLDDLTRLDLGPTPPGTLLDDLARLDALTDADSARRWSHPPDGPVTSWTQTAAILGVSARTVARRRAKHDPQREPWFADASELRAWWSGLGRSRRTERRRPAPRVESHPDLEAFERARRQK